MNNPCEKIIKTIPSENGVYQFYDKNDYLIYVGKAKNLKSRVSSYFSKNTFDDKTSVLIKKITNIKYVLVSTEMDALLLENNLIKTYKPKYNILLKDDKNYPWICISTDEFPKVFQTRKVKEDGSEYFGPYMSTKIIKVLLDFFSDLFYNAGWDPFSYLNKVQNPDNKEKYLIIISEIRKILKRDINGVISFLSNKMIDYSNKMEYEKAQKIKEKITVLNNYQSRSLIVNPKINNVDVFSIVSEENYAFVNYLRIVSGAIVLSHNLEIKKKLNETDEEILELSIIEIREKFNGSCKTILLSQKLKKTIWKGVSLIVPRIGDKKKLIELSLINSKHLLFKHKKQKLENSKKSKNHKKLNQLKKDLRLSVFPRRIECFDNSNIQGYFPVASCVVFKNGTPSKKEYRIFNIKTVVGANDFASMSEVIYRRYSNLLENNLPLPQLIVIDGGIGQLNAAIKSIKKLNLSISIIGIAKKLEKIYIENDKTPIYIDKRSSSLKTIQYLRNEAHRFAIMHHRRKRLKSSIKISLEEINGIGPKTIERLIKKFGSVKQVFLCEKEDLEKFIGKHKANKILKLNRKS